MIVTRVEKHVIKPDHAHYDMLLGFCHLAKNLYNQANYEVRQTFFQSGKILCYNTLDAMLKQRIDHPDYRNMPTAQCAQQVLRMLASAWTGFQKSSKDYAKRPEKYLGKPKVPKYLDKDGYYALTVTNQNCKLKSDGLIHFPKSFQDFTVKPLFTDRPDFKSFQQVRIIPKKNKLILELVYKIETPANGPDNGRYVGIDPGVNNLACVANNFHESAFVINGRPLKSINQYYNKHKAELQSGLEKTEHRKMSNRLYRLTNKRNAKVDDYMHKASRYVIDWCKEHDVSKIIIGKNINWKQNVCIGRKNSNTSRQNDQNFVSIPHARFIDMLSYKAEECGITVITVDERYTSGTSAIDDELPEKANYNKSRRVHRGMFKSNAGIYINADLNAAYQMMKKVVPFQWDRGSVLHPVMVNMV